MAVRIRRKLRKAVLIPLLCFGLSACAVHEWRPLCRHTALYCASIAGDMYKEESYPVRIALGTYEGSRHAQAQAFIEGSWRFLAIRKGIVVTVELPGFEPDLYVSYYEYSRALAVKSQPVSQRARADKAISSPSQ